MEVYLVGGAVRDLLLGRIPAERDWVVIGATPGDMLAAGYRRVGNDFPVFLHPITGEEHALARTERKTGRGYLGFETRHSPEVTLEDDLRRRDLTINAIARAADGTLIDPCGGRRDLEARILRHVSPAFVEDPVRVLRVARFPARFAPLGFTVAAERWADADMVAVDMDALVPERVWQENRARSPSRRRRLLVAAAARLRRWRGSCRRCSTACRSRPLASRSIPAYMELVLAAAGRDLRATDRRCGLPRPRQR